MKIGVYLHGIPYCDVSKFIQLAKKWKVADTVGICDEEHSFCDVPREKASRYYTEWAKLFKELGLYFHFSYSHASFLLTREDIKKIKEIAGDLFLGVDIGELSGGVLRGKEISNMQEAKDTCANFYQKRMKELKNKGIPSVFDIEVGPLGHGESLEGGADVCFSEHADNIVLSMSSARGATKAYKKPLWGAWLNMEYYGGSGGKGYPEDDSYTPAHQRRMMLDYNLSYIYGAEMISLQDCIFNISIAHNTFDSTKPKYDFNSKECKGFRRVAKRFYKYVKTSPRAKSSPLVNLGFVLGNLEAIRSPFKANKQIWGQSGSQWKFSAENGWAYLNEIILQGQPHGIYRGEDSRYSSTPYGQIDIILARAPVDVLQQYKALVFLGWNTMTMELYERLKEYVKKGGHLFMSIGQLSEHIDRKEDLSLINNGKFSDLFGLTVKGKCKLGKQPRPAWIEKKDPHRQRAWIKFNKESRIANYKFPVGKGAFLGSGTTTVAKIDLDTARVLAVCIHNNIPIFTENRLGKGAAFLLTNWGYPIDSPLTLTILKTMVEAEQGDIKISGPMCVRKNINYAIYPGRTANEETKIYLVNIDWTKAGNIKKVNLNIKDKVFPIKVREGWVKTINYLDNLALSPRNESVYLSEMKRDKNTYSVTLSGKGECVIEGYLMEGSPKRVELDGDRINLQYNHSANIFTVKCKLTGKNILKIRI